MADIQQLELLAETPSMTICIVDGVEEEMFEIQELPTDTGHSSFNCTINVMVSCTA